MAMRMNKAMQMPQFWLSHQKLHGCTAGDNRIHSGLWVAEGRA